MIYKAKFFFKNACDRNETLEMNVKTDDQHSLLFIIQQAFERGINVGLDDGSSRRHIPGRSILEVVTSLVSDEEWKDIEE